MEVAASSIAFVQAATGIAKCIIKAKQFWSQVQDVPEDIQDLIIDLEVWKVTLTDVGSQLHDNVIPPSFWSNSSVKQSLSLAERAHIALDSLVRDMDKQLQSKKGMRRKMVAAKICIKKDALERFEKKLSRSLRLLQTSLQAYQLALIRYSPQMISRRVTDDILKEMHKQIIPKATVSACVSETIHDGNTRSIYRKDRRLLAQTRRQPFGPQEYKPSKLGRLSLAYAEDTGAWQAYLQWPSWLSQTVYELCAAPVCGWTCNLRSYSIFPAESEVTRIIEKGDLDSVRELFNSGKVSLFDRDSEGHSLLDYAVGGYNYQVCKFLLARGLDGLIDETVGAERVSPLSYLTLRTHTRPLDGKWEMMTELFQSYLPDADEMPLARMFDFMHEWTYDDEHVAAFRKRFLVHYYTVPLHVRLEAVRLGSFHLKNPYGLKKLLSEDVVITEAQIAQSRDDKLSLVHSAALALGIRFAAEAASLKRNDPQWKSYHSVWSYLVTEVTSAAKSEDLHSVESVIPWDVHCVPVWKGTPLISVLGGALCHLSPDINIHLWDKVLQNTLRQWLHDLVAAGVDLIDYGTREQSLVRTELRGALDADAIESSRHVVRESLGSSAYSSRVRQVMDGGWTVNHWVPVRIVDLRVGPNPDDWQILWAPEFEYIACQFWDLIEKGASIMPGSWVED